MISFAELGLDDRLIQAITDLNFTTPTEIQEKAIPVLLSGEKDFIGLAQTGTGKTAAFGLPLLHFATGIKKNPMALVICPTRELCMQLVKEMELFKKYLPGIEVTAVYGGTSISMQMRDLKRGTNIVIATPGRLIDLIERKAVNLSNVQYVVLDEADEMLNMGFREDIEFVLQNTPARQSTWLFSATMPAGVRQVSKKYMETPVEVTIGSANTTNKNIDHQYYITSHRHRFDTLKRIIDFNPGMYGIIFTRTRADAQDITDRLTREGYDIDALHGDLSQQQRDKVMGQFRDRTLQLLIATDVAARGIDVKEITHVINYELPDEIEVYTHRSGRTGRAGNTGISLSIITPREAGKFNQIQKLAKAKFSKLEIPSGNDVCRKQFFEFIERLLKADISHGNYETYMPLLTEKFASMSKEEVLQRVAAMEFDRFLKYYENAEDLNAREGFNDRSDSRSSRGSDRGSDSRGGSRSGDSRGGDRGGRGGDRGGDSRGRSSFGVDDTNKERLYINVGMKDGFYKASFLQFVLDMSDLRKDNLGSVELHKLHSIVYVDRKLADKMVKSIDRKSFKGRMLKMNVDQI